MNLTAMTDYHKFGLGKAPLEYRIQRYLDTYGRPKHFIPIHKGEYNNMIDKHYTAFNKLEKLFGMIIRPIGFEMPTAEV